MQAWPIINTLYPSKIKYTIQNFKLFRKSNQYFLKNLYTLVLNNRGRNSWPMDPPAVDWKDEGLRQDPAFPIRQVSTGKLTATNFLPSCLL